MYVVLSLTQNGCETTESSIDRVLSFSDQITLLCQKGMKVNKYLSRLTNELTTEARLLLFKVFYP